MTAVIAKKKPAKAAASRAPVAAPNTLAHATEVAMSELSIALELIESGRTAATNGEFLDRTLRVAEEMAIDVMGWMDHGQHDRHEWSDRMFDCQSLLKCAAAYNESPAATLASAGAAAALDRATEVLDQPFPDETPVVASVKDHASQRLKLAFNAHYQQAGLISGLKKLLEEADTHSKLDNGQMHVGIVSRIELLANVIFHAARLDGSDGAGWGNWDQLDALQRAFDGSLA